MAKAYVLVNVSVGKRESIIDELEKVPDILEVQPVFGAYDIIVTTKNVSEDKIRNLIMNSIRSDNDVRSSITLMATDVKE